MKITINVHQPVYDNASGIASIKLTTRAGQQSEVSIDFETLLPFANLAQVYATDFFIISASVYGIDRFIERRVNSTDGWSRELKVSFPVAHPAKWKEVKGDFDFLLSYLTGDYWDVDFHKSDFTFTNQALEPEFTGVFLQVNLFSGGLDSLIGAIDILKEKPAEKILLVSHYDPEMRGPKGDQHELLEAIEAIYPGQFAPIPSVKVFLDNSTLTKETTFRSRSILFIGLALLAAQAKGIPSIIVPENGTVSLNYPLSPSRRSSCSTRTTHPTVLQTVRRIWKKLNINTIISNPYELCTKGEMVAGCKDQAALQKVLQISNSCGKRGHRAHWDHPSSSHCGICMPCIYRRAALVSLKDSTSYGNDINLLNPFKTQKGQDAGACLEYLSLPLTLKEVREELIINGVKDISKIDQYAGVVLRTREELRNWVKKTGQLAVKNKAGIQ